LRIAVLSVGVVKPTSILIVVILIPSGTNVPPEQSVQTLVTYQGEYNDISLVMLIE